MKINMNLKKKKGIKCTEKNHQHPACDHSYIINQEKKKCSEIIHLYVAKGGEKEERGLPDGGSSLALQAASSMITGTFQKIAKKALRSYLQPCRAVSRQKSYTKCMAESSGSVINMSERNRC